STEPSAQSHSRITFLRGPDRDSTTRNFTCTGPAVTFSFSSSLPPGVEGAMRSTPSRMSASCAHDCEYMAEPMCNPPFDRVCDACVKTTIGILLDCASRLSTQLTLVMAWAAPGSNR